MFNLAFTAKPFKPGQYWHESLLLVTGCNAIDRGCLHCWARRLTRIRQYNTSLNPLKYCALLASDGAWNGVIRTFPERLNKLPKKGHPRVVCIWNDLFHNSVPFSFIKLAFDHFSMRPHMVFIILTKRVNNLLDYFSIHGSPPANCLLGTSFHNNYSFLSRAVPLHRINQNNIILSYEPAISPVTEWEKLPYVPRWIIAGEETYSQDTPSKKHFPFSLDGYYNMVDYCWSHKIPFYVKRFGKKLQLDSKPFCIKLPNGSQVFIDKYPKDI